MCVCASAPSRLQSRLMNGSMSRVCGVHETGGKPEEEKEIITSVHSNAWRNLEPDYVAMTGMMIMVDLKFNKEGERILPTQCRIGMSTVFLMHTLRRTRKLRKNCKRMREKMKKKEISRIYYKISLLIGQKSR